MRKPFISVILFLFSLFICFNALSENVLVLPDDILNIVAKDGRYEDAYDAFMSCSQTTDKTSIYKEEYENNKERPYFRLKNIAINNSLYDEIHVSFRYEDGRKSSYNISIEYECPLGEKIEDSQVFINTVNAYHSKYERCSLTDRMKEYDEIFDCTTVVWKIVEYDDFVQITYYNGDIKDVRFPEIKVSIYGKIE